MDILVGILRGCYIIILLGDIVSMAGQFVGF